MSGVAVGLAAVVWLAGDGRAITRFDYDDSHVAAIPFSHLDADKA